MKSLLDLPIELIHDIALRLSSSSLENVLNLMVACKKLETCILSWPGWRDVSLPRPTSMHTRVGSIQGKDITSKIMFSILPKLIGIKIVKFDVNGHVNHFDDNCLHQLRRFVETTEFLDIGGSSKLTEAGLMEYFATSCSLDCLRCQPSTSPTALLQQLQLYQPVPSHAHQDKSTSNTTMPSTHKKPLKILIISNLPSLSNRVLKLLGERCSNNLEKLDLGQLRDYRFSDAGLIGFFNSGLEAVLGEGDRRVGMKLRSIDLYGCKNISDSSILAISNSCPQLEVFNCSGSYLIGDAGIIPLLQKCLNLKQLDVSYCWRITDICFGKFSDANEGEGKVLVAIDIQFCYQLSNQTLTHLSRLPKLGFLCLIQCQGMEATEPSNAIKREMRSKGIIIVEDDRSHRMQIEV